MFFLFKYSTGKILRNNLFNFITLKEGSFFFKLKELFLWRKSISIFSINRSHNYPPRGKIPNIAQFLVRRHVGPN